MCPDSTGEGARMGKGRSREERRGKGKGRRHDGRKRKEGKKEGRHGKIGWGNFATAPRGIDATATVRPGKQVCLTFMG